MTLAEELRQFADELVRYGCEDPTISVDLHSFADKVEAENQARQEAYNWALETIMQRNEEIKRLREELGIIHGLSKLYHEHIKRTMEEVDKDAGL